MKSSFLVTIMTRVAITRTSGKFKLGKLLGCVGDKLEL